MIRRTHKENYEAYGYRRMWKALGRAGEHAPRCQVQRLMVEAGIQGAKRRGKPWRTTTAIPRLRSPDLVKRDFTASRPNALWVGSQYTSGDYTQELTDHDVLGSIGTVGDALDNALAESYVDSYKTELIADRMAISGAGRARDRHLGRLVQPPAVAQLAR